MSQSCSQLHVTPRKCPLKMQTFQEEGQSGDYCKVRALQGWGFFVSCCCGVGGEEEMEKDLSSLNKSLRLLDCNSK